MGSRAENLGGRSKETVKRSNGKIYSPREHRRGCAYSRHTTAFHEDGKPIDISHVI